LNTARVPRVAGGVVIVIGLGALAGWQLDVAWLKSFAPGQATMSPAAALGLVLLGSALWLSSERETSRAVAWVADACAAAAALIGLVRLSGYLLGFDPGLDHLLFGQRVDAAAGPPSRLAFQSALNLLLVGAALLLQRWNTLRAQVAVQLLAVAAAVVALVGVTAHAYGTRLLYGAMSLNTAVAFLTAAAGVLWRRPDRGFAALVASPTLGGGLTRRLLPAIIVVPLLLGWLRLAGQQAGLYDTAGGTALFASGIVAVLGALAWWSARSLDQADAQRAAAEQALRGGEHRLFQILEAMPIAVFVLDAAGQPYYANQASREILGRGIVPDAAPEQLPEVYQAFIAGTNDPYPAERQPIVSAMKGQVAHVADIEIHRPERIVPLEVWAAPVRDPGGQVAFAVAAFSDITERQRAQQALRATQARLQQVLASSTAVIYGNHVRGTSFAPSWVSENITAMMGYDVQAAMDPAWWLEHLHPEDRARVLAEVPALFKNDRLTLEYRFRHADGTYRWVRDEARVARDGSGAPVEVFGAWVDITEHQRAQEALRESEERFRTLAATANDAIISADAQGDITYFNPGAERIFGYTAAEVSGKPLTVLMPEGFRNAHRAGLARYLATGEAHVVGKTVELAGRRKDGTEFPLDLSLASWKGGAEVAFTGILRDITERKRAEDTQRRYAAQLEAANAELDAFAYAVSHDLRAPLRAIDGFGQALLEDYDARLDDAGRGYLQRVRAGTQRMGVLIDDLLRLSRVTRAELHRVAVDLSALAESVAAELKRTAPDRAVEVVITPGVTVEGDPRLLRVVLENLLGNAWKYTGKNACARIEFGVGQRDGKRAYFVRDDGAGFDMTYAAKLFGAFQRLHSSAEFEGTGVGLATVQRIVHRHGGQVWADGALGRGATFYFTL